MDVTDTALLFGYALAWAAKGDAVAAALNALWCAGLSAAWILEGRKRAAHT